MPLTFFAHGFEYKLFGFIPIDRHLIGVEGANPEETLFLLGTDLQGRDMWSRLMYATRMSLTIGLVGVAVSLVLGVILGGISGFYGGLVDTVIQRDHRDPALDPDDPALDGSGGGDAEDLDDHSRSTSRSRSSSR